MTHVAIVIVDFNSGKETHECLESLSNLRTKDITISTIVVDNASKAPLVLTREEKNQKITLITNTKNLGFTGGYNTGISYALSHGADFVMLINNDTFVDKNLVEELVVTCQKNPTCGIAVPKIYFAKGHEFHRERYTVSEIGRVLWYAGGDMDWANVFSRHRGVDEVDHGQYDNEKKVEFATGCCMMLPSIVLKKVGMFNTAYFLYFEDADLSQRVIRSGFHIMYQPKAVVWHVNAASGGGSGSPLHDYYLTRNRMLFGMTYAPFRTKLALVKESVRLLLTGREWQKKGIFDFYRGRFGKGSFDI